MHTLNLPKIESKIRKNEGKFEIFDIIRKKYIRLTPEEWVRQHFIHFLIDHRGYPKSLIKVETGLKYNSLQKRPDIIVYDKEGSPFIVIECKASEVKITQASFDQVSVYNTQLMSPYIVVSNGLNHYCCSYDRLTQKISFIEDVPFCEA